jgi:Ion channel
MPSLPIPRQDRVREQSLTALLVCLLLLIFGVTPLVEQGVIGQLAAGVLWAVPGILAVLVVSGHPAAVAVILAATGAGLATALLDRPSTVSALVARFSAAVALGVLGSVIAGAVFGPGRVTWHRIRGGVALYLIVALFFAHLYGLLTALVPNAFSGMPAGLNAHAVFYRGRLLYFSLVTLTTTGYGDIVPLHSVARSLTTLEAVIGPLPGHPAGPAGHPGTARAAPFGSIMMSHQALGTMSARATLVLRLATLGVDWRRQRIWRRSDSWD